MTHSSPEDHEKMVDEAIKQHKSEGHSEDVPVQFHANLHENPLMAVTSLGKMLRRGGNGSGASFLKRAVVFPKEHLEEIKNSGQLDDQEAYHALAHGFDRDFSKEDLKNISDVFPPEKQKHYEFLFEHDKSPNKEFTKSLIATSKDPYEADQALANSREGKIDSDVAEKLLDRSLQLKNPDDFSSQSLRYVKDPSVSLMKKAMTHPSKWVQSKAHGIADFSIPEIQDHILHQNANDDTKYKAAMSNKLPERHMRELRSQFAKLPDNDYLLKSIDNQLSKRFGTAK